MNRVLNRICAAAMPLALAACAATTHTGSATAKIAGPVTISVGPCFGLCPVYEVTVSPDGTVDFVGQRHTAALGERRGRVGAASYRALLTDLSAFRPVTGTTVQIECTAAVTDTPSYTITWSDPDSRKTIATHQGGCPGGAGQRLDAVLQSLPDRLGIAEWMQQVTRPGVSRGSSRRWLLNAHASNPLPQRAAGRREPTVAKGRRSVSRQSSANQAGSIWIMPLTHLH